MKRLLVAALILTVSLVLPALAFAQADHASPKASFPLSEKLVVGDKTLEPGNYTIQCKMIDGKDYLVVTGANGKEVTRVPCTPQTLTEKITRSDYRSTKRADGTMALVGVRIKGESVEHRVVSN